MQALPRKLLILVALLITAYVGYEQSEPNRRSFAPDATQTPAAAGVAAIAAAWQQQAYDVDVEAEGRVARLLSDDNEGSRHQRFTLELSNAQTILIAHNIDLAPRINDLRRGDTVRFRGVYEWNERGGVVHWTHHDPQGRRAGGWLEHNGRRYE